MTTVYIDRFGEIEFRGQDRFFDLWKTHPDFVDDVFNDDMYEDAMQKFWAMYNILVSTYYPEFNKEDTIQLIDQIEQLYY